MNEKEVCFIICTNDELYMEECIYYINQLEVPEGFSVNVLTVTDAKSMTSGYNEAMNYSNAKYKVYLHQDVFIVNHYFIRDFLNIFQSDEGIGMIGMIGSPELPEDGIMWHGWRCGALYDCHVHETTEVCSYGEGIMSVAAIDGLMMITQYDIPWREDLFDKWDFYDASQSMEFRRCGYKVAVPRMKEPWCIHDCGYLSMKDYQTEREKFVKEYLRKDA